MIEIKNVSKRFGSLIVLEDVSFQVKDSHLVVILGPSGTGKTVLLKSIIGLQSVDQGEIVFDGITIDHQHGNDIYKIRKNIGFVFQGTALFDSMNVFENISLPLVEHTPLSMRVIRDKVNEITEIIGMSGKEFLYPRELSGGMKRLVAVGRALALDPKYLFYDEPTTALDPIMRERVVDLIIDLKKNYAKSGIVVTHDLETAKAVGDEIFMLKKGKLGQLKKIGKEFYNA